MRLALDRAFDPFWLTETPVAFLLQFLDPHHGTQELLLCKCYFPIACQQTLACFADEAGR